MATKFRNYFAGFSFLVGYQYGHFRSKEGERARPLRVVFSGNDSSYTRTLPLVYGRARVADPILLIAKPEGDFLTTLWAVCEGLIATNPADNTQTTPVNAYSASIDAKGQRVEHIYVNGESRHDLAPGFGIEVANGDEDRGEPIAAFFPTDPADFLTNHLGYWGTARVTFRISTKDHPSVDLTGGQVSGNFEVQFGRVHRVYSTATTYVLRATDDGANPGASPSFVQMDLLASKRAGGGLDYARLNIQSFVDFATYCRGPVTNVFDGTSVKRWTFNGIIDQTKSLAEWLHVVALGSYSLPPYPDKDGLLKIRALKAEDTSSVPLFSSKVASVTGRNILWENGHSSLRKTRRPITDVPNELRVNFIDKNYDPQYIAQVTGGSINGSSDPVSFNVAWSGSAVAAGVFFQKDDKIIIDSEQLWITKAPSPGGPQSVQTLHCQRAYAATKIATHVNGSLVQFVGTAFAKISVVVADRDVQNEYGEVLGDQSRQVISKTIDLPGTTTEDEAARIGTLILRAGEFGQGGLANNNIVTFKSFYRDAEDLEIGDVIEVEDDQLSPTDNEIFYRVTSLSSMPVDQGLGAGIVFSKEITAVLHDNAIYDDTALSVSDFSRINGSGSNDIAPPPVTSFAVAENGIFDPNNKPVTTLTFDYVEPDPPLNFRDVIIFRSSDDGAVPTSAPVGDWRYITEVLQSGQTMQYPISGQFEWFAAVSRPNSGHTPDVNTLLGDGSYRYPRVKILVDGVTDVLPAPSSPAIAVINAGIVQLTWLPYTGSNLALYKSFHVYRNSVNNLSTAILLASFDGTLFLDSSVSASTTYYYWIVGFSVLNQEGTPTAALSSTTGSGGGAVDTAAPDAPTIAVINDEITGFHANLYNWLVLVNKPSGAANWNSIDRTIVQIATNSAFTAFPTGISLDGTETGGGLYSEAPPKDVYFSTGIPGTYYVRAKVHNSFGDSAWSSPTISRSTNYQDALAADTDIPGPPDNLTVTKNPTLQVLGGNTGNAFNVSFRIPKPNTQSEYGYSIYIHNSPTLPAAVTQYSSFTHAGVSGSLSVGSNVLTAAGAPGWTVNAWTGKDLVVFGTHRGATPTFDYEGLLFIVNVISNTASTITFTMPSGLEIYALSGLGFYIVNNNVGDHFYEKLVLTTPLELDQADLSLAQDLSTTRTALFIADIPTVYVWVALYNLLGQGKVTASPPSLTFSGTAATGVARFRIGSTVRNPGMFPIDNATQGDAVTSDQIANGAVIAAKLTANSMGWVTSIVFSAANNTQVNWTAGTIKTADGTTYSIGSGNTGAMAALTYIYLNTAVSKTALQVTTNYANVTGDNIILLCVAQNSADALQTAFFVPAVGTFGINSTVIGPNSISTGSIQASAITTNLIGANQVTAAKINVSDLFAQTITATGSITGATIRTAVSGQRIELDSSNGLRAFNSSGVLATQIWTGGFITTPQIIGMSGPMTIYDSTQAGAINITPSTLGFGVSSGTQMSLFSDRLQLNGAVNYVLQNGQYVGVSGNTRWVFNSSSSMQGYVGSTQAFAFDTTSSTTQLSIAALYNGTLTRLIVDGSGFVKVF